MTAKARQIFMALVGAYLTYIGGMLVKDSIASSPKYETLLIVFGGAFVIFGVVTVLVNVGSYIKEKKAEQEPEAQEYLDIEDAEELTADDAEEIEETVDSSDVIEEEE